MNSAPTSDFELPKCCSQDYKLIFDGEYDMPTDGDPATVLDIGGNVGIFSAWAALAWPKAKITAYEPWTENLDLARKNLSQFGSRINIVGRAVRGTSERSRMFDNGYSPLRSFHINYGCAEQRTREVDCIDAANLESAEFVKIDTEGSELEILQRLDLSATKYIALEAHNRADANRIASLLCDKHGFALHNCYGAGDGCLLMKFIHRSKVSTKPKLFVAVPTYSGSPSAFWQCLMRLQMNPPCNLQLKNLDGDSLVSRARNTLTAEFLRSDCTHMLFIDSDLIFSPDQVGRLMDHKADVVAGFYPKKQDGALRWVCNASLSETAPDENGLQEVRYMGTGFLRVAREVFLRMITEYGDKIAYNPDHSPQQTEYDLWPVGVYRYPDGHSRYLSEDWYFCQRWLDLGGKVYGDTKIVLKHLGQAAYPLLSQRGEMSRKVEAPANSSDSVAVS